MNITILSILQLTSWNMQNKYLQSMGLGLSEKLYCLEMIS